MNIFISTLINKFGGVLVGSAAARHNGIDVVPSDWDITFPNMVAVYMAAAWLEQQGWEKVILTVPAQYMRNEHTAWKGRMSPPDGSAGEALCIDMFSGAIPENKDGVAVNKAILTAFMGSTHSLWDQRLHLPYSQSLLKAIGE